MRLAEKSPQDRSAPLFGGSIPQLQSNPLLTAMQVSKNLMKLLRRRVSTDYLCAIAQNIKTTIAQSNNCSN
jgi:hypothetical protein